MNFLDNICENLRRAAGQPVLREARAEGNVSVTGAELLALTAEARAALRAAGLMRGDRCAIVVPNSIRWVALDLALMAEGIVTVPLYARQAPAELAAMLRDAQPALICVGDAALNEALGEALASVWPEAARRILFDEIFAHAAPLTPAPTSVAATPLANLVALAPDNVVTIIYTSGTSGEAKGVQLNRRNLDHMLGCTGARLDLLMGRSRRADQVFHYLPFCFAGSWERWIKPPSVDNAETDLDEAPASETIDSFTIITRAANDAISPLHDRMPVIIAPSHFGWWLKDDDPRTESHKMALERAPDDPLKIYPVSDLVNSPTLDDPRCIEPVRIDRDMFERQWWGDG